MSSRRCTLSFAASALALTPLGARGGDVTVVGDPADSYYDSQRLAGIIEAAVGALYVGAAVAGRRSEDDFVQRGSVTVLAGGVVLLMRGTVTAALAWDEAPAVRAAAERDAGRTLVDERARADRAADTGGLWRLLDLYLVIGGAGTYALADYSGNDRLAGFGVGAAVVGATMWAFDEVAAYRVGRYADALAGAGAKLNVDLLPGGLSAGWSVRF